MSDGKILPPEKRAKFNSNQALQELVKSAIGDVVGASQQKLILERLSPQIETYVVSSSKFHSGPLPSVETVRGYEDILPGSFERILTMAETDQKAVVASQERAAVQEATFRSQSLGAGIMALALILGVIVLLALTGHTSVALGVCGLGAAGIVTAFVNARFSSDAAKKTSKQA